MSTLQSIADIYTFTPWLAYGVGPLCAGMLGFFVPWVLVELAFALGILDEKKDLLQTAEDRAALYKKHSYWYQLLQTLKNVVAPYGAINGIAAYLLLPKILPTPTSALPSSLTAFATSVVLHFVLKDFFNYVAHRSLHESPFMYEMFHKHHHQVTTPTVVSVGFIDPVDSFLQAGLPILLACTIVRGHPISFAVSTFCCVVDSTMNHSGLDNAFVDILTLRFLPYRTKIRHHDNHHKFSSYSGKAKSYGESLVLWDMIFGTIRQKPIPTCRSAGVTPSFGSR